MFILASISMSNISTGEVVIAIVGYLIVFIALVSLYGLFRMLPRIIYYNFKKEKKNKGKDVKEAEEQTIISGEETAAIAMALHLILDEMHDEESRVLTIKKVSKAST